MPYSSIKLRRLRELFGYSQAAVAFDLQVSQTTYCRYETGQTKPDPDQLEAAARLYGLTLGKFMEHESVRLVEMAMGREAFRKSRGE